jgi:hypothetical protein
MADQKLSKDLSLQRKLLSAPNLVEEEEKKIERGGFSEILVC